MDQLSRTMVTHTAFRLFQGDYGHPHTHTPPRIRGPQIDSRERLSFYLGHTETKLVRLRTTCHVSRMVTVEKQCERKGKDPLWRTLISKGRVCT